MRAPKPRPPFKVLDSVNYLHGGSNAPKLHVETNNGGNEIDTAWRLLWGTTATRKAPFHKRNQIIDSPSQRQQPIADKNDLLQISALINGAFNGFNDRVAIFKRAHKTLNAPACQTESNRSAVFLSFEQSAIYQHAGSTFGWALWHDPTSTKEGVTKNAAVAKAAYQRFLVVHATHPSPKRFGLTPAQMVARATEKSQ